MSELSHTSRGVGATAAPGGTSDAQSVTPTFTRWPADGVVRYLLAGHVDLAAASTLAGRIGDDLRRSERSFVLDFTDAGYVDGRALEVFKQMSQRIVEVQGRLVFDHVSDDFATLLELTRLDRLFVVNRS